MILENLLSLYGLGFYDIHLSISLIVHCHIPFCRHSIGESLAEVLTVTITTMHNLVNTSFFIANKNDAW